MKAHISHMPRIILAWNLPESGEARRALDAAAGAAGVPVRPVGSADAGSTVGRLCGFAGASEASLLLYLPADAYPPAAIFCGLREKELDQVLAALRAAGAAIPLKAVVTPHNQSWPLCELLKELEQEHAALHPAANTDE